MKDKQIKQTIHYALVVDESGSMSSYRTDTIGGFNEQVKVAKELQEQYKDQNYLFTLCTFEGSNEIKQRIFQQPIAETVELTTDNYSPRGSTALFQAVGETILKLQPKVKQGDKVI
jgi:3-deoxy-D-arabino-heptulosonate 7-phosphate (DAHP) synthase